jgi:hypothetical protein
MKIKITIKYHLQVGNEIYECKDLEHAERKLKHMSDAIDRYLIKSEYKGDKLINQYLVG